MKKMILLALAVLLASCNLPAIGGPEATATPTITATLPPTETPAPTATFTLAPTATQPLATNTPEAVLTLAPTATQPPPTAAVPTLGLTTAVPRALFTGTFPGGQLTFRIGELSSRVIPKTVILKGAECKEGGQINDSISFEPPPSFEVDQARFTMTQGNQVTISGQFLTPTRAAGTITLRLRGGGKACTVGPLNWIANADGG